MCCFPILYEGPHSVDQTPATSSSNIPTSQDGQSYMESGENKKCKADLLTSTSKIWVQHKNIFQYSWVYEVITELKVPYTIWSEVTDNRAITDIVLESMSSQVGLKKMVFHPEGYKPMEPPTRWSRKCQNPAQKYN